VQKAAAAVVAEATRLEEEKRVAEEQKAAAAAAVSEAATQEEVQRIAEEQKAAEAAIVAAEAARLQEEQHNATKAHTAEEKRQAAR
jgi:fused signal recognition particle receptor